MKCQKCESERILSISGKCSDLCSASIGDRSMDGYVPRGLNIGSDDYIEFKVCLNCGQIQGTFPVSEVAVNETFPELEEEEEEEVDEEGFSYGGMPSGKIPEATTPYKLGQNWKKRS